MTPIHWIADDSASGRLGVMARPRSGDWLQDEIAAWRAADVGLIVCLLEDHEIVELGLTKEAALCAAAGIDFIRLPIADRGVPANTSAVQALCYRINDTRRCGLSVAIHCRAGIGRSGLIAAASLSEFSSEPAFGLIREARGVDVPDTDAQRDWIRQFKGQD